MDERNETNPLLCVSGVFVPEDMARKIREVATAQGLSVLDIFSGLALLGAWTIAPPTRALIQGG